MNLIEQLRHLRNLVNDDYCAGLLVFKRLIKKHRATAIPTAKFAVKQVNIDGITAELLA